MTVLWILGACRRSEARHGARAGAGMPADSVATYPLDPLSGPEIAAAARAVERSGKLPRGTYRFAEIVLDEPPKDSVRRFRPGATMTRAARLAVVDLANGQTYDATADVARATLTRWQPVTSGAAPLVGAEYDSVRAALLSDDRWRRALERRGITEPDSVHLSVIVAGDASPDNARRVRVLAFLERSGIAYLHPVEGLVAVVNVTTRRVERVIDIGSAPVSAAAFDSTMDAAKATGLRTLEVRQPDGPSFRIDGHAVGWAGWHFRFAPHPRDGLVLYEVSRDVAGANRRILSRASLSEMLVPYGSPDSAWYWRAAFDLGEYMLGNTIHSLARGIDVPANASLFPATLATDEGEAIVTPNAVAIYERDGGLLRRHGQFASRARELVVRSVFTVGNYDYGLDWIFNQDGSLRVEVELTGVMFAQATSATDEHAWEQSPAHRFGHLVAPGLAAVHHQHFFNFRLDFDVDGEQNDVVEVNTEPVPRGAQNPHGNAFATTESLLTGPRSRRDVDANASRWWKVINPNRLNALGQPVGYALVPGETAPSYLAPDNPARRRGAFVDHQLWITTYAPDQLNAAGRYPRNNPGPDGVEAWTNGGSTLTNADVVVWYTLGVTHVPRPEDWPVMPVVRASFVLKPIGFDVR